MMHPGGGLALSVRAISLHVHPSEDESSTKTTFTTTVPSSLELHSKPVQSVVYLLRSKALRSLADEQSLAAFLGWCLSRLALTVKAQSTSELVCAAAGRCPCVGVADHGHHYRFVQLWIMSDQPQAEVAQQLLAHLHSERLVRLELRVQLRRSRAAPISTHELNSAEGPLINIFRDVRPAPYAIFKPVSSTRFDTVLGVRSIGIFLEGLEVEYETNIPVGRSLQPGFDFVSRFGHCAQGGFRGCGSHPLHVLVRGAGAARLAPKAAHTSHGALAFAVWGRGFGVNLLFITHHQTRWP